MKKPATTTPDAEAPTPYQAALSAVSTAEAHLLAVRARLAAAEEKLTAAAQAKLDRHAHRRAVLAGYAPATNPEALSVAAAEGKQARIDAEILREMAETAERELVRAEDAAGWALKQAWGEIATTARADLVEAVASLGNRAWRADLNSGAVISWRDFMKYIISDAEALVIERGSATGGGVLDAPTGIPLPDGLERSPAMSHSQREQHRRALNT